MKGSMLPYEWLVQAHQRILSQVVHTPLTYDSARDYYLKWENRQVTGSFKARGALNKILALQPWERQRGLVAASAGNHGQGVALAGRLTKAPVTVFCSETAAPNKIEAMRQLGAGIRLVPGGYGDAEQAGKQFAASTSATWISPYNDAQVIAGQGTISLEVLSDHPELSEATWIVPTSGGGLISGIGIGLKRENSNARLIGAQAEASPFMYSIFAGGSQDGVADLPTIADGLSGPVEIGSVTIPIVLRYVDQFILLGETELLQAIAFAWWNYGEIIEGSAAAALAAALSGKIKERPLVIVISGGNIGAEVLQEILKSYPAPAIALGKS